MNWQPIEREMREGLYLVTNNLAARDAQGRMSHVWLTSYVQKTVADCAPMSPYLCYPNGGETRVSYLTHFIECGFDGLPVAPKRDGWEGCERDRVQELYRQDRLVGRVTCHGEGQYEAQLLWRGASNAAEGKSWVDAAYAYAKGDTYA